MLLDITRLPHIYLGTYDTAGKGNGTRVCWADGLLSLPRPIAASPDTSDLSNLQAAKMAIDRDLSGGIPH